MATKVTYNGEQIAEFENDTKTLKCSGKIMLSDVGIIDEPSKSEIDAVVELNLSQGNQVLPESEQYNYKSVTISKPATLLPENIKKDVVIAGVTGTHEGGGIPGGYSVTFYVDGVNYAFISVIAGDTIQAPSSPTKPGYTFTGWYSSSVGGSQIVFPYTPTSNITLYSHFSNITVIGFTGLSNSSGALTWTDDISNYPIYSVTTSGNYATITSSIDNIFPFNQIEEFTDSSGNKFVKFPKLWVKWIRNSSNQLDGIKISNAQADSEFFIPDCFLDPKDVNCSTYLDYFALGKYEASGSTSKIYSKSNQTCLVSVTRPNARSAARSYGSAANYYNGYQLIDFSMWTLYNFLTMLYYKTSNIQNVMPGRTSNTSKGGHSWSAASITGTIDNITSLNGYNTSTDCIKILGVENPFGNVSTIIDGICFSTANIYAHRLPQYFSDTTNNAVILGFNRPMSNGVITALRSGTSNNSRSYAYCSQNTTFSNIYFGDFNSYTSNAIILISSGSWDGSTYPGLWYSDGYYSSDLASRFTGHRLAYRPV